MARLQMALKFIGLSQYPLDGPFPDLPPEAVISRGTNHVEAARREGLTLREVLIRSSASNAHFTCKGTPQDIADELQSWFEGGACDGFNLLIPIMPASLDEFIANVLSESRRRGLVRTDIPGAHCATTWRYRSSRSRWGRRRRFHTGRRAATVGAVTIIVWASGQPIGNRMRRGDTNIG